MGHVIRNLLALQEVDLQIISLNEEKARLLDSINEKRSELEKERVTFEEREAQLRRLKVEMKNLEVELGDTSDRIRKLESQQIHIKTNQEYKALDKEIYEAKTHQARIEDELLQKMEFLEQENVGIREASEQLEARSAGLQEETGGIEGTISEIEGRVAELHTKRPEVAGDIEDELLRLYDRIFNSKKGAVLVPLVNRACQGCHLAVPAAVESVLRRRAADIIRCENCSRILYIPHEEVG